MDTDCYGPGNRAAPTCPTTKPSGLGPDTVFDGANSVKARVIELVPGKRLGPIELGTPFAALAKAAGGEVKTLYGEPKSGAGMAEAGPYQVSFEGGKVVAAAISLRAVKQLKVGDRELGPSTTVEQAAQALSDCKVERNRGATVYRCKGSTIAVAGPTTAEIMVGFSRMAPTP